MSAPRPGTLPRRTFGVNESALDDSEGLPDQGAMRTILGRFSFGAQHRPSFVARWRRTAEGDDASLNSTPGGERPPIPTMMQPSGEAYTTPLPVLSMIVLSIVSDATCRSDIRDQRTRLDRLCLASSCRQMFRHRFYYSWSRVRSLTFAELPTQISGEPGCRLRGIRRRS